MKEAALQCPAWLVMWLLAACLYFVLKALTLMKAKTSAPASEITVWLLFCPTLNLTGFLRKSVAPQGDAHRLAFVGLINFIFGAALLWVAVPCLVQTPMMAAWVGMVGLVFMLHFGCFHLVTAFWMFMGHATEPLMKNPMVAGSLAEFWARRWNTAFRDALHLLVFRPVAARWNAKGAHWLVFLTSGLLHEAVISLPAGAGWGGPTAYFLLQALGIELSRRLRLRQGVICRLWTLAFLLAPLGLLFHPPFIHQVILPFLKTIGAMP
ncbi:MAG: MBOAT family protein [Prosthecobacter sp.]|uniref:MBOAT family protein n=1 Tax=Prosthecobacter sp. TaxID=1965333 RepID=UPI00390059C9